MSTAEETALAFAKQCLGWQDAEAFTIGWKQTAVRNLSASKGAGGIFNASDLNAVIAASRVWCKQRRLSLEFYYLYPEDAYQAAVLGKRCHADSVSRSRDPCHAIMEACVEAQRKLEGEVSRPTQGGKSRP